MEKLPGCAAELGFEGLIAEFGRDGVAVLGGRCEVWCIGEGIRVTEGAMEGFLDGAVVFMAHVAGVEDEPEEDDNHGDEHKARGRTPWHLGQKACLDVTKG